jgi:hypothetical protein
MYIHTYIHTYLRKTIEEKTREKKIRQNTERGKVGGREIAEKADNKNKV